MQRTSSGLLLPDKLAVPVKPVPEPELELTMDEAEAFIANNPAIQRDLKKARKAYARLQETIKYEADALARSKEQGKKGT